MSRARKFFLSYWQQGIIVVVVFVAIRLTSGSQNCSDEPCMYGICMNSANSSYSCYCIDGYTGINCEINWDDCWSDPCLNGGTCSDAVASYNCTCPEGFAGSNCELKYSECMNQPCMNNGTCIDANGFLCQCLEGYSGDYCEIDASVCNNTICKNAGECVEGPGYSFYCRCTEGWTGLFCEEDVDECVVSPCQNGGLCLNMPATYTCACLFGFTGKDCDKAIVPCDDNPCENDAMCLLEDSEAVCYCVPDYHGQLCELRYDDCESKFAKCENGGTCIDGINNFTCACPPTYGGDMCVDQVSTLSTIFTTTSLQQSSQMSSTVSSLPTTIYLTTQDTPSTSYSTDTTITTIFPQFVSTFPSTSDDSSSSTTKKFDHTTSTVATNPTSEFPKVSKFIATSTTPTNENVDSSTLKIFVNNFTETTKTDFQDTTPSWFEKSSAYTTTDYTTKVHQSTEVTMNPTDSQNDTNNFTTSLNAFTNVTTFLPNEETSTMQSSTTTSISETIATTISSGTSTKDTSEARTNDESWTIFTNEFTTTEESLKKLTSEKFGSTTLAYDVTTDDKESRQFVDTSTQIYGQTTVDENTTEKTSSTTMISIPTPFTTITEATTMKQEIVSTISSRENVTTTLMNCSRECNDANCSKESNNCDCNDRQCKNQTNMRNVAFNGKSYVRQNVIIADDGSLRIFIRLKTKSRSGVIVHAFFDDERYVLLYMEGGQLKFQFSCGLQTMLLGEIDSPINNGHDVDVEMRFQYLIGTNDIDKCSARLLVNDTMAMSGEQILSASHENIPRDVILHLGGIPRAFSHFFPRIAMGFVGCMSLLKVNNVSRHLIRDSSETYQIEECTSFACLLNPCRNFGSCHDFDGQVYCKCIAGYSGAVCERSACDDNPCYLGATCISSPGTGFICVCPMGMHGLFCDQESEVVQPSFSVFIPGFSSYAAYGLTNVIKDGMELRMRLVPHTLDQISLIAYLGQTGGSRGSVSDHFSVTYVRGYIMLTWDLGSGVRRIFTKSPLRTRAHRPHTVQVGRRGRDAWLSVDGVGNVTGQAAGTMTQLDVSPILYIGGHKSRNFDALPHDLPLHSGFSGCIFDIELQTDNTIVPITKATPATGRGVGECHRNECSHNSCKNGALCLNHGPTYSCVCMNEWEGADCSVPAVMCSSSSPYKCQKANTSLGL